MMSDKNPYVLLGIPFGSSRDRATRAFARKAKGRRRARSDDKSDLTELTWALNQVSDRISDPRTALDVYRIPADPSAFEPGGHGLLRPPPEPMPRTSTSSEAAWGRLLDAARTEAVAALHHQISSTATLPER